MRRRGFCFGQPIASKPPMAWMREPGRWNRTLIFRPPQAGHRKRPDKSVSGKPSPRVAMSVTMSSGRCHVQQRSQLPHVRRCSSHRAVICQPARHASPKVSKVDMRTIEEQNWARSPASRPEKAIPAYRALTEHSAAIWLKIGKYN